MDSNSVQTSGLIENANNLLQGVADSFGGVKVTLAAEQWSSVEDFGKRLEDSVEYWKSLCKRGIWLKISLQETELIPEAVKHKFVFHHAQPSYVMMIRWLPSDEPNQLPGYSHTYIGVGGFVTNDNNQLLVIKEKYNHGKKPMWKLPGGHSDLGEELAETAKREVLEETGIKAEFVSILSFRHQHKYRFGLSDIYFVCHMKALTTEITACPQEIEECKWMDLDEYLVNPEVSDFNQKIARCFVQYRDGDPKPSIQPDPVWSSFQNVYQLLYSIHTEGSKPD
ncbi:nucleoside diphosphate-linked moiety X motif 6-like [Acanthaster planci]|uniref:Nucleoside diphosphate-linked moiety X motif 6-like n=1 Tax=Acanthaster planci TaxID=133434 RepID=A0A8B7ZT23_ACAPL|nr:nucleoside diphosphate-linked moiety X motif 6-like [Acanthaster planci]